MREIKVMKTGATALFVAIGLGFVLGPTPAGATPTPLHSKHDRLATDDGWTMELNASELVVNPMHNLAETPTSREGWISSKVEGRVAGDGKEPIQAAILEHFLVVGCGVDVSDGTTLGLSASAGPSVGVTISGVPSATLGASASVSPSISAHIRPGKITELSLGKKQLQGDHASIRVKRARVSVDGCLGKTSVRIIARTADDTINVF